MNARIQRRHLLVTALASACANDNDMSFAYGFQPGTGFDSPVPPASITIEISQTAIVEAIASVIPGSTLVTPVGYWRADQGVTLGGTLKAGGTSPPAVTITGTLALNTPALVSAGGVQLRFTTGGARGVAIFDVSYDNGATWAHTGVTTAATYALDGNASGIILNFPTGTYATTHTYKATAATWTSSEGNARVFTNATAAQQPVYEVAGDGGKPSLLFDGLDDRLVTTDSAMVARFTNGATFTLWYRHNYTTADRSGIVLSATNSASANGSRRFGQSAVGNGRHVDTYTNDAASTASSLRPTPELDTSLHTAEWYFESNQSTLQVDGDSANPNGAAFTPGTLTPTRVTLGCNNDNSADSFHAGRISRVLVWDTKLNSAQASNWRTELA